MAKKETAFAPTHTMMKHPRTQGDKNFPVAIERDDGNGAGVYVDAEGERYYVRHVNTAPAGREAHHELFSYAGDEENAKRGSMVTVLRNIG